MRIRFFNVLLLLTTAIPLTGYGQSASQSFSFVDKGATSFVTDGSGNLSTGYARILPNSGQTAPSGVAIFDERIGPNLVSETGVPASPLIKNGLIYAEVGPNGSGGFGTDIGLAIANPSSQTAAISFSYTKTDGTNVPGGTYNLLPGQQKAAYLDGSPWNLPLSFQGTFTFTSSVPVSVIALQLFNNQRGEPLITTLPVIDTTVAPATTPAVLSYFVDGAGWSTSVLLVNPTIKPMAGSIRFNDGNGAAISLTANGQTGTSFPYTVAAGSSFKLQTADAGSVTLAGSVTVTPASGNSTPVALSVFSYANGAGTVSQAGVPPNQGTAFRMYVEATQNLGAIGSFSTGFSVANATSAAGTITFDLYTTAGTATGLTATFPIAGLGYKAGFLADIFPSVPLPFQGILRVTTSSSAISVVALRIRYNERSEFLMTTTPPSNEGASSTNAEFDFPQIANGSGWTTQFNLFSGILGQATSGTLQFVKPDSTAFLITTKNLIVGPPVILTSIAPTTAAEGSAVTLAGSGFTSSSSVVFTTSSGTGTVTPSSQTATALTATVPSNAITGPVIVQNGAQSSSPLILQVTAAGGGMIQTAVNVGAGTSVSGADIYVPTPSTAFGFLSIGVGAPGSSISAYPASAAVTRGAATQQLLLIGTGLAASTTVSVSGSGVTLSGMQFQQGVIFVNVAADVSAPPGYRNVTITNPGGDVSIMTGGLLIQ